MHTTTSTALIVLPLALAAQWTPSRQPNMLLVPRQGCAEGYQSCGQFCIDSTEDCCPDYSTCDSGDVCQQGTDGVWFCCPEGETCSGSVAQTTAYVTATAPSSEGATPESGGSSGGSSAKHNDASRLQSEGAALAGLVAWVLLA